MEESAFPFRKLRDYTLVFLDVIMNVDRSQASEFMFTVNKESRSFVSKHYFTIQNGFINEGLIVHNLSYSTFSDYEMLEKLYF
jgi:hypothetical protein